MFPSVTPPDVQIEDVARGVSSARGSSVEEAEDEERSKTRVGQEAVAQGQNHQVACQMKVALEYQFVCEDAT